MLPLYTLLFMAGLLHFGILIASALTPQVLDWRNELQRLALLMRQLIWVHGIFIVITIIGFGVLTVANARALAGGTPLARSVCGFIALFWASRLAIQFFVFDAKPFLKTTLLKVGYHGLTVVFTYLCLVYGWAAILPTGGVR